MTDGNRVYPVDELFFHHSTGPDFNYESELQIQDWYSNTGKARGYTDSNGNIMRSYHEHPSRPGVESYAMAQFTLRQNLNNRGNGYDGWELIELIKDWWNNVTWSVGNWPHNQRSISVEVCGNYLNKTLPNDALRVVMDFWRPHDKELGGKTTIWAHQWVYATACPGLIVNEINLAVDILNNPAKYEPKPASAPTPAPTPTPAPPTAPEWKQGLVTIKPTKMYAQLTTALINLETGQPTGQTFPKGQDFSIAGQTTVNGVGYWLTEYAVGHDEPRGLPIAELGLTAPVDPPAPTPAPTTPTAPTFGQKYAIEPIVPPMTHYALKEGVQLINLDTGKPTGTKTFARGEEFTAVASAMGKGGEYYITAYSLSKAIPNGVRIQDFGEKPSADPTPAPAPSNVIELVKAFLTDLIAKAAELLAKLKG